MGIGSHEMIEAGSIMGTKIVTNEFVAMLEFQPLMETVSEKTIGIVTVFLTSFANFSSIGIIAGTVKGIDCEKESSVYGFVVILLIDLILSSIIYVIISRYVLYY